MKYYLGSIRWVTSKRIYVEKWYMDEPTFSNCGVGTYDRETIRYGHYRKSIDFIRVSNVVVFKNGSIGRIVKETQDIFAVAPYIGSRGYVFEYPKCGEDVYFDDKPGDQL